MESIESRKPREESFAKQREDRWSNAPNGSSGIRTERWSLNVATETSLAAVLEEWQTQTSLWSMFQGEWEDMNLQFHEVQASIPFGDISVKENKK